MAKQLVLKTGDCRFETDHEYMNVCERCGSKDQMVYLFLSHRYCYDCCDVRSQLTKQSQIERFESFKIEEFKPGDLVSIFPDMIFGTFYEEGTKVHHILVCGEIRQINKKLVYRRK